MRADRLCTVLACLLAVGVTAGCASSRAPQGWLPDARGAQRDGYGGWIEVEPVAAVGHQLLSGELLAISDDSVFVLTPLGVGSCALAGVRRAELETYNSPSGSVVAMAVAGTLGSVSTGAGAILVAPMWILVGFGSSAALSRQGKMRLDTSTPGAAGWAPGEKPVSYNSITATPPATGSRASWKDMRIYARFPQGLPDGLNRTQLRGRQPALWSEPTGVRPGTIVRD